MEYFKAHVLPMLVTCTLAGVVLAIIGPYGTSDLSLMFRFSYWIGLALVGGFAVVGVNYALRRKIQTMNPLKLTAINSIASTTGVFCVLMGYALWRGFRPSLPYTFTMFFYIWVIAFVISFIGHLSVKKQDDDEGNKTERPTLLDRIKPNLRSATIYALSAEDHYVRVYTSKGEDLILMRLSDAIKEAAPLPGLSSHRSWWVAEAGVAKTGKKGLTLHTGQTVPISRTGAKAVKAAGWT